MDAQLTQRAERLEHHLNLACDAEGRGDCVAAEQQFRRALFYESKLRGEGVPAKKYVALAGPVYPAKPEGDSSDSTEQELQATGPLLPPQSPEPS
jgi:hypothetical protein